MRWLIPSLVCLFLSTSNSNSPEGTSAAGVEKDGINDVENVEGTVEGASSSVASGSDAHMAEMLAKKYAHYHDMSANGIANHDMSNEPLDYVEKHHSLHAKMSKKDDAEADRKLKADLEDEEHKHILDLDQYLRGTVPTDPNFARIMQQNGLASDQEEEPFYGNGLSFKKTADESTTLAKERQTLQNRLADKIYNDEIEKLIHEMYPHLKDLQHDGRNDARRSSSSIPSNKKEFVRQQEQQIETNTNEGHQRPQGQHSIRKAYSMDDNILRRLTSESEHYSAGPSSPATASYSSSRPSPSSSVHENAIAKGYQSPNYHILSPSSSPLNDGNIARAHSDPVLKNVKTASVLKRSRSESDILFDGKTNGRKKGKSPNWQGYDSPDFHMLPTPSSSREREHSDSGDDSADDFAQRRIEGVMPKKENMEKMEGEISKDRMEERKEEIEKLEMKHAESKQASSALALSHNQYPPQHPIHSRHPIHFETVQKPERVKSLSISSVQQKSVPKRSKSVGIEKAVKKMTAEKHGHLDAAGKLDIAKIAEDIRKRRRMVDRISALNKQQQQQQQQQQHMAFAVHHSPGISGHVDDEEIQALPHPVEEISEQNDLNRAVADEHAQQNENHHAESESSSQLHSMPQPHAIAPPKKRNSRWANIVKSFGPKKGKA